MHALSCALIAVLFLSSLQNARAQAEVMEFLVSSVVDRATADLRVDKWSKLIEHCDYCG